MGMKNVLLLLLMFIRDVVVLFIAINIIFITPLVLGLNLSHDFQVSLRVPSVLNFLGSHFVTTEDGMNLLIHWITKVDMVSLMAVFVGGWCWLLVPDLRFHHWWCRCTTTTVWLLPTMKLVEKR
jgi:hypothetical protein